jgi:hypothetical protein
VSAAGSSFWVPSTLLKKPVNTKWSRPIPPTQLVVRSYSAYTDGTRRAPNPTNAVGGSFILGLQERLRLTHPGSHQRSWWIVHTRPTRDCGSLIRNPTNAVGGSFILSLHGRDPPLPESHQRSWWIVHTRPTRKTSAHSSGIPPTHTRPKAEYERSTNCVGGIRHPRPVSVCRLSMNDPPTALVGFGTPAQCPV